MSAARQKFQNLLASGLILLIGWGFYGGIPYYQQRLDRHSTFLTSWELGHWQVLQATILGYALLLFGFYLLERQPGVSKSVWCLRALRRLMASPVKVLRNGFSDEERLGLLATLLKFFFVPIMIVWLFVHLVLMVNNGLSLVQLADALPGRFLELFNTHGFWFLFQLILFVDVLFFTVGYLVELPILKNEIRSVDSTWLGWGVALICYPPLNSLTGKVFGWHSTDFPQFGIGEVHLAANFSLLALMGIYSWSSVALRFKASNLTHRGIVAHGPYRWVRHPAYICKNLAWWIGLLPALWVALQTSLIAAVTVAGSMVGWTFIYFLRALTEERHLRSVDGEYDAYCQKVKYRFIPGVI